MPARHLHAAMAALCIALATASCATPDQRAAEKERRTEEAQVGVITKIVDIVMEYKEGEKRPGVPGQRINVLLQNEQPVYVVQRTNPNLRVGDRVRIERTPAGPVVVPE
jgi:hypothetical protein